MGGLPVTQYDGKSIEYVVPQEEHGLRLDSFLAARRDLDLSRSQIQKLIATGAVLVNHQVLNKSGYRIKEGDNIHLIVPEPEGDKLQPEDIPVKIVFADDHLLVVDKPAGMVVHPAPGHGAGTLVNALLYHHEQLAEVGENFRPGIVHRLDKDTSGLLIVAKSKIAYHRLVQQLKLRQVERIYLALVKGELSHETGLIVAPIGRHPVQRKKMAVTAGGKEARTRFIVRERFSGYTLLEVKLETGRTHQIRVHLAYIGYPVVGDPQYGKGKNQLGLKRQALHAAKLCFYHPLTGHELYFTSPLPEDFQSAIRRIQVDKK
jgi:23S rRNA pseudouridine1911/1915/1917 synthase